MSEHRRVRPYAERSITGGIYLYLSYNPDFLEWLKATVPAHERSYDPETKRWYIGSQYTAQVVAKARTSFPAFPVDGVGGQQEDRPPRQHNHFQGGGFDFGFMGGQRRQAPPPPPGPFRPPASSPDHAELCVTITAPPEVIRAAYKALAKLYHPDNLHGDTTAMQRINAAYDRLKKAGKA